jgi:hypothetical protein
MAGENAFGACGSGNFRMVAVRMNIEMPHPFDSNPRKDGA